MTGLLPLLAVLAGCGGSADAQAQTREAARAEVRERLGSGSTPIDTATAAALSSAFRAAAERALPAVVYVSVEQEAQVARGRTPQMPQGIPEEFRRFFQFPDEENFQAPPQQGAGSGFIIDAEGHIVTNHHVVANASRLMVRTVDGREYNAEVVGSDPNTDIALIKVNPGQGEELPVINFADSDNVRVGDWVLALGNPLGFDFTVTAGIVSAKGRRVTPQAEHLESFIQTDAAINMGNSGGPLVDLLGRVVGVNTMIAGGGNRFVGYGFAVPSNLAQRVVRDLRQYGYARRPRLGVTVSDITSADAEVYRLDTMRGADIGSVEAGSPADAAGIEVGDVVVALNGRQIADSNDLTTSLARFNPGERVTLTILRQGQSREIQVTLGEFPRPESTRTEAEPENRTELLLGFAAAPLTPRIAQQLEIDATSGVVVTGVQPSSPAAQAGLRPGQIIQQINGQEVGRAEDVARIAAGLKPGDVVSVRVRDPQRGETIVNFRTRR
jgi:Do/DeqQ family serine protease